MALDRFVEQRGAIIGAAIQVQRALGLGMLETIYQHALAVEIQQNVHGARVTLEMPLTVKYLGVVVGQHRLDLVVRLGGALVVVETKHFRGDEPLARARAVTSSYVAASGADVGLILNFAVRPLGIHPILPYGKDDCADSA